MRFFFLKKIPFWLSNNAIKNEAIPLRAFSILSESCEKVRHLFIFLNNSSAAAIIKRDDTVCLTSVVALGCFMNRPVAFIEKLSNE